MLKVTDLKIQTVSGKVGEAIKITQINRTPCILTGEYKIMKFFLHT